MGGDLPTSRVEDRQGGSTAGTAAGVVHGQELGFAMRSGRGPIVGDVYIHDDPLMLDDTRVYDRLPILYGHSSNLSRTTRDRLFY